MLLYGEGSLSTTGFADCVFNQFKFDSSKVQQQHWSGQWSEWLPYKDLPIHCKFSSAQTYLQSIVINICKADNSGSNDKLTIEFENESGNKCITDPMGNLPRDQLITKSVRDFDYLENKCKDFEVTTTTHARLFNNGTDDLCITDLQLDVVDQTGKQRIKRCTFDVESYHDIIVNGEKNIPLVCN